MSENNLNTVTLMLDDNTTVDCMILCILPVKDKEYIALLPADDIEKEEGRVYLYRITGADTDEPQLDNIMDDEEFEMVSEAYDEWCDAQEYEALDLDALGLDALE